MNLNELFDLEFIKKYFPVKTFFVIIGIWILLAILNFVSLKYWKFTGADILFPFSVIYPSSFLVFGFFFATIFLIFGGYVFLKSENLSIPTILLCCVFLVLLGNLAQGNLDIAFRQPFYLKGRQYYHDAVKITNSWQWLRTFTDHQNEFQMHTKTHPPFVVLLHYWILKIFKGNILALGIVFFLISSLFFTILKNILKNYSFDGESIKKILLFSAVIPSVNIYSLVSIDGIILMTSSLMLLAISRMFKTQRLDFLSVFYASLSIFLTNSLSFSGLFLIAFLGLLAVFYFFRKEYKLLILLSLSVVVNVLIFCLLFYFFGYNHWLTFHQAAASENPGGFMLFHQPYIYFWTRAQDVGEILMFLSLGVTAVLFSWKKFGRDLFGVKSINLVFVSGIFALGLMFLSGAYGTGETARACLFIVPFFILLFKNLKTETLYILYFLSLFQTFGMQLIGNYFW